VPAAAPAITVTAAPAITAGGEQERDQDRGGAGEDKQDVPSLLDLRDPVRDSYT